MAIRSFRSKALEGLFTNGTSRRVPKDQERKLLRLLDHLDAAKELKDLQIAAFHQLTGDRRGTYAWRVTAIWRLTFRFDEGDAYDVDLEDYH